MENFITILSTILGSGAVAGIITLILYRRENKALKRNEVQSSDLDNESKRIENETRRIENDLKQIDVGSLYLEKVQGLAEIIENSAKKMVESNSRRDDDWKVLKEDMDYVKTEVKSISDYLNGDYKEFKKNGKKKDFKK